MTITTAVVTRLDRSIFDYGMAYVVLSRVKRLDQLWLEAFDRTCFKAHPSALAFDTNGNVTVA